MKPLHIVIAIGAILIAVILVQRQTHKAIQHEATLEEMPINITYRKAVLGSGYVLKFENREAKPFSFVARITSAASKKSASVNVVVDGKRTQEIGHLEGWAFAPGDEIELTHDGYRSKRAKL